MKKFLVVVGWAMAAVACGGAERHVPATLQTVVAHAANGDEVVLQAEVVDNGDGDWLGSVQTPAGRMHFFHVGRSSIGHRLAGGSIISATIGSEMGSGAVNFVVDDAERSYAATFAEIWETYSNEPIPSELDRFHDVQVRYTGRIAEHSRARYLGLVGGFSDVEMEKQRPVLDDFQTPIPGHRYHLSRYGTRVHECVTNGCNSNASPYTLHSCNMNPDLGRTGGPATHNGLGEGSPPTSASQFCPGFTDPVWMRNGAGYFLDTASSGEAMVVTLFYGEHGQSASTLTPFVIDEPQNWITYDWPIFGTHKRMATRMTSTTQTASKVGAYYWGSVVRDD